MGTLMDWLLIGVGAIFASELAMKQFPENQQIAKYGGAGIGAWAVSKAVFSRKPS